MIFIPKTTPPVTVSILKRRREVSCSDALNLNKWPLPWKQKWWNECTLWLRRFQHLVSSLSLSLSCYFSFFLSFGGIPFPSTQVSSIIAPSNFSIVPPGFNPSLNSNYPTRSNWYQSRSLNSKDSLWYKVPRF